MSDLLRRVFQPARKQSIFRTEERGASGVGRVFGGLVACLIVVSLLASDRLVSMAERKEFGESRDRWLAAAEAIDDVASAIRFDRPASALQTALGRGGGDEPSEIVLGELAADVEPTSVARQAGSQRPEAAPSTTTTEAAPSNDASTTTTSAPPSTTTSTLPPTTEPPVLGSASIDAPLRVWTGGDSLGEYVGSELLYRVAEPDLTAVELDFAISTGLARPDFYDWPGRLTEVMQRDDRPSVVVFMVGGNDDQDLLVDGERVVVGTPEWFAAYRARVATMMDIAAYPDVQMLWINLPPMRDERRETISLEINAAIQAEADLRPWVDIVDIVDMFTGPDGGYEQFIDAPDGSVTRNARANDGVHITRSASSWVAELVWEEIQRRWTFDEAVQVTSTTADTDTDTDTDTDDRPVNEPTDSTTTTAPGSS